jgi:hypothetical protein
MKEKEPTPFEKAFPEARVIQEKLDDMHKKIMSGEMSPKEANPLLMEVDKFRNAIADKIFIISCDVEDAEEELRS